MAYFGKNPPALAVGSVSIDELKYNIPEGYLQRSIINLNYAVLQNIYQQRHNHRLNVWKVFCEEFVEKLEHPEFIIKKENIISNE